MICSYFFFRFGILYLMNEDNGVLFPCLPTQLIVRYSLCEFFHWLASVTLTLNLEILFLLCCAQLTGDYFAV